MSPVRVWVAEAQPWAGDRGGLGLGLLRAQLWGTCSPWGFPMSVVQSDESLHVTLRFPTCIPQRALLGFRSGFGNRVQPAWTPGLICFIQGARKSPASLTSGASLEASAMKIR